KINWFVRNLKLFITNRVTPAATTMGIDASFNPETGGLVITFRLEAHNNHHLTVGEKATLSYKGSRFEGYQPDQ
ncbi:hypothetical protein ACVGV7_00360, partial [Enterobacter intestinihominis]